MSILKYCRLLLSNLLICFLVTSTIHAQNVTKVEYFTDFDPGIGNAISIPISAGTDITANFTVPINSLSPGFHRLYVRGFIPPYSILEDGQTVIKGGWSLTGVHTFYKDNISLSSVVPVNIVYGEFFADTDPGFGNGINIPVSPSPNLNNLSFALDITSLSPGFHKLYVRFRDANGTWSVTNDHTFYKENISISSHILPNITAGEYFIDTDPGSGNGIPVTVTPGPDVTNVSFTADITALTTGFHKLYIRFKDANGMWSLTNQHTFYKENTSLSSTILPNITQGEYFIDSDPGFGSGNSITITPSQNISNISFTADISSLSNGFHKIYTRFKDATGTWSLTNNKTFYKENISTTSSTPVNINKLEYYIDSDPGFGLATDVPVTASPDINNLVFMVDMSTVTIGNHRIYVRARDVNGTWSLVSTGAFKVNPPSQLFITLGTLNNTVCAGASYSVPFTVNASFGSNNIFTAQLSDPSGNFSNPVNIGTLAGTTSGTINATIPSNYSASTGYKLRVTASSPLDTSDTSKIVLTINRVPETGYFISGVNSTCIGTQNYSPSNLESGTVNYAWTLADGGTLLPNGSTAAVNWNKAGNYLLNLVVSNGCGNGSLHSINVTVYNGPPVLTPVIFATTSSLQISNPPSFNDNVTGYQWFKDGNAISSSNSPVYSAVADGSYTLKFINPCGAGPVSNPISFLGNKLVQTVTFPPIADFTFGDHSSVPLNATASSSLPVTYSILSGPASLSGNNVLILGAGTISIRASQAGDGTYASAFADQSFTVNKATATIALGNQNPVYDGSSKVPSVTTTPSGLSYTVLFNDGLSNETNAGSYPFTVTINSSNYQGTASGTLTIQKADQSINMAAISDKVVTDAPFNILASATSGLPLIFSFTSNPANIISISGNTITIINTGTVTITTKQAGNNNYNPAPDVTDNFTIHAVVPTSDLTVSVNVVNTSCGFINGSVTANVHGGKAPFTYLWNTGATSSSLNNVAAGTYLITITDSDNFTASAFGTVLSSNPLAPPVITSSLSSNCTDQTVTLTSSDADSYLWSTNETSKSIQVNTSGNYGLTIIKNGCTSSASKNITIIAKHPPVLAFTGGTNYTSAVVYPLSGTPTTTYRFEVRYTDADGNQPLANTLKLMLDYEGNGSFTDARDRIFFMAEKDPSDHDVTDGKDYYFVTDALPGSDIWKTTIIATDQGGCTAILGPLNGPLVKERVNLAVFANDISFSNPKPDPNTQITVYATIHNNSGKDAQNFVVHLINQFQPTTVYPDIIVPFLAGSPGTNSMQLSWNITTPVIPAWCPMQVVLDYTNVLDEVTKLDNQAIRPFTNGNFKLPGDIKITAQPTSPSIYAGGSIGAFGHAEYRNTAVTLLDPSCAGATITATITETGQSTTGYTSSDGQYNIGFIYGPVTPGNYHIKVHVTDYTLDGDTSTTFIVVVLPPCTSPDLSSSINLSDGTIHPYGSHSGTRYILAGQSLTGTVTVTNYGQLPSQAISVLQITLPDGTPVPGPFNIPPVNAGQNYVVTLPSMTFNYPVVTYIQSIADYNNDIQECIETNHTARANIVVLPPLPDITPDNANGTLYYDSYQCQFNTLTFGINNIGGVRTGVFNSRLTITHNGTTMAILNQSVNNIDPLERTTITFNYLPPEPGLYTFRLDCDMPEHVVEVREDNNSTTVNVMMNACLPDLTVSGCGPLHVLPVDPMNPGTITISTNVGNGGLSNIVGPFDVDFNVAGTHYRTTVTGTIAPGSSRLVSITVPTPAFGDNTLFITGDIDNVLTEITKTNNFANGKLCWDFALTNVSCAGQAYIGYNQYVNQPMNVQTGLLNFGLYFASHTSVKFELSGPGIVGWLDLGNISLSSGNQCLCPYLAALPTQHTFTQTGLYYFRMTADYNNQYIECDETNNQLIVPVNVGVLLFLPDYITRSEYIAPSLLNPDVNEPVILDVTYKNQSYDNSDSLTFYTQVDNTPFDSLRVRGLVRNELNTVRMNNIWSSDIRGVHVISAIINKRFDVIEPDTSNNRATRAIVVGHAPNLFFSLFKSDKYFPPVGTNISITSVIKNEGIVKCFSTLQIFYVDNANHEVLIREQPIAVDSLDSITITTPWRVSGNYKTTIIGRIVNSVPPEFNLDDNEARLQIGNLNITTATTKAGCQNTNDGTAKVIINGGVSPFSIQWSTGQTVDNIIATPGTYTVTVTDAENTSLSANVVIEAQASSASPSILAPATIHAYTDKDHCYATITDIGTATTINGCSVIAGVVTNNAPSNGQYPAGTTTVTWSETDDHGITQTATQDIIVSDIQPPTVKTKNITRQLGADGTLKIVATDIDNGSFDNCGIDNITVSPDTFNITNVGDNTVTLTVTDIHGNSGIGNATVTILPLVITTSVSAGTSAQYSDQVSFTATVNGAGNTISPASSVTFMLGTQPMGTVPLALNSAGTAWVASVTTRLLEAPGYIGQMAPGTKTITAIFNSINPLFTITNPTGSFTILPEDARPYFTGSTIVTTMGTTISTANITLSATVKDISAVPTDPSYDIFDGDIRNARVKFVNRMTGMDISGWLTPGQVTLPDKKTGTVTFIWTTDIGSASSANYVVGIIVDNGYYIRNSSADNTPILVNKPVQGCIYANGTITLLNSSGIKAGDRGTANTIGFYIYPNKTGSIVSGTFYNNFKRMEGDGKVHTYSVQNLQWLSLALISSVPYPTSVLDGYVKLVDITNTALPVIIDNHAVMQVTMTDRGTSGITDGIGINVWNNNGGLWFSSNWDGTTTREQNLATGNIIVTAPAPPVIMTMIKPSRLFEEESSSEKLVVSAYPNPSAHDFILLTHSGSKKSLIVRISDQWGRVIESRAEVPSRGSLRIGGRYRPGTYYAEFWQGSDKVVVKMIKLAH